ncbi:hypothetical protein FH972_023747 [Carpinus fangiana]|uniref:Tyrosyl-DNA phosphodiesterase n=1 Tax=Carpinus fangiana TaxID=176857 RepID=A0A5N6KWH0_9ROSI|nr:hypothetical protein FH972_023747 [Carpinus fangiana]
MEANKDARRKRDWSRMMGYPAQTSKNRPSLISAPTLGRITPSEQPHYDQSHPQQAPHDQAQHEKSQSPRSTFVPSPVSLTTIPALSSASNVDTVSLSDILGDLHIIECWNFNFLHDVDFVIVVDVKIVHGSWDNEEDGNRRRIDEAAACWPNVQVVRVHIPDESGSHHSKLMVLFRNDDTVQVVVHTSNMIPEDWLTMTNAVWLSPKLPLLQHNASTTPENIPSAPMTSPDSKSLSELKTLTDELTTNFPPRVETCLGKTKDGRRDHTRLSVNMLHQIIRKADKVEVGNDKKALAMRDKVKDQAFALLIVDYGYETQFQQHPIGFGERFKVDFIRYLSSYKHGSIHKLVQQLIMYDFSKVRGAFVASVPQTVPKASKEKDVQTSWGWVGLREILSQVPCFNHAPPVIVTQVSSIAKRGGDSTWLQKFESVLHQQSGEQQTSGVQTKIIFPTPDEIRQSLGGYYSGPRIHMPGLTIDDQEQLAHLRSRLCHWVGGVGDSNPTAQSERIREAARQRAAPHTKTIIRFSDKEMRKIDWAMLTSTNLSAQAWGFLEWHGGVKMLSYEAGVIVWPELYEASSMVPVFQTNDPEVGITDHNGESEDVVVGFRMPYDLPLVPYAAQEEPWCATKEHMELDCHGNTPGSGCPA